jgi:molybdopterin-containing oxidoreductase family membrane subunit
MAVTRKATGARRIPGVLASFVHVDAATDAIRALRARGMRDLVVYSAAPNHEIEEALEHRVSPVRLITLIGGLTGCAAGFGMTLWMSHDWPALVGGKPIGSIPPYVVIAFELTILLGALSTVVAVAVFSILMGRRGVPYDPGFSDDKIGVFVPATRDLAGQVEQLLRNAGAVEVRYEGA